MGRNLIHLRHETALIKEIRGKFNKMKIYLLRARMVNGCAKVAANGVHDVVAYKY